MQTKFDIGQYVAVPVYNNSIFGVDTEYNIGTIRKITIEGENVMYYIQFYNNAPYEVLAERVLRAVDVNVVLEAGDIPTTPPEE